MMTLIRRHVCAPLVCLSVLGLLCTMPRAHATQTRALHASPGVKSPVKKIKPPKVVLGKVFGNSSAVQALAADIAQQRSLPLAWVQQQLAAAHVLPQVQQMMRPSNSPTAKNWAVYRARFIEPQRIQAGVAFWQTHADDLARAEHTYGVPAQYIVGILGVETYFGEHQGQYKVLDALATLSLAFPPQHPQAAERQAYFKNELGFHLQQRWSDAGLKNQRGSYAGAIGWPQFMPSSVAQFGVDFDHDGHVNLSTSASDAIGSVARYFQAYGWQTGMPTHFEVTLQAQGAELEALLAPDIVPTWSAAYLAEKNVLLSDPGKGYGQALALVELFNGPDKPSYVAGTDNFFVITRYNRSSYYAMAVIELGEAVKQARQH